MANVSTLYRQVSFITCPFLTLPGYIYLFYLLVTGSLNINEGSYALSLPNTYSNCINLFFSY